MPSNLDPTEWRDEFPILSRRNYLNSCSLGALSHRALARVGAFHQDWHEHGASAWYETWIGRLEELRGRVAGMIHAEPSELAYAPSVSWALTVIASAIRHESSRDQVVVTELDFPTVAYQWRERPDVEVVQVPSDDGATIDLQRIDEAVTDRTAAIVTSHVFFTTGAIQDLAALSEIARRKDTLLIVDAYQSAGQVPIDVRAADLDVLMAGPLKWLLGGPGLAYLYVRDAVQDTLRPTTAGWFGARDQFDFDIGRFEFKEDARRYELGTPSLPTAHAALGGQEIIDEIGVDRIRERNRALIARLVDRAAAAGFEMRLAPQPERRSAIIMVATDDPAAAVGHLAERDIIVDWRPGYVRISPHFYNTEAEIDQVVDELQAWRDAS